MQNGEVSVGDYRCSRAALRATFQKKVLYVALSFFNNVLANLVTTNPTTNTQHLFSVFLLCFVLYMDSLCLSNRLISPRVLRMRPFVGSHGRSLVPT